MQRDESVLRQMVHGIIKKMRRRGSKGKGRVLRQYFERTSAVRLLIHSLETRCFRRVLQWVIARGSVILNSQVPLNSCRVQHIQDISVIYKYVYSVYNCHKL